jgi:hypothetical protein
LTNRADPNVVVALSESAASFDCKPALLLADCLSGAPSKLPAPPNTQSVSSRSVQVSFPRLDGHALAGRSKSIVKRATMDEFDTSIKHEAHPSHAPQGPHRSATAEVALEIVRGRARHRVRPIHGPVFVVGTALDGDLVLGDPQFPDAHCYLMKGPEGIRIKHLGALPELSVNGHPTSGMALSDGDRIRMGPYEFLVRITPALPETRQEFSAAIDSRQNAESAASSSSSEDELAGAMSSLQETTASLRLHAPSR